MMKDVEKAAQRRIARQPQPLAGVLREMERQWSVGTEQAEQPHLEPRWLVAVDLERRKRRRRKRQVGVLSQPHGLVDRTEGLSPTRLVCVQHSSWRSV